MNDLHARYEAARELARVGQLEQALKTLETLISPPGIDGEASPTGPHRHVQVAARITRASVWRQLGREDEAATEFGDVILYLTRLEPSERLPQHEELLLAALTNRGNALDAQGRKPEALEQYDRALDLAERLLRQNEDSFPRSMMVAVLINRAHVLAELRLDDRADTCFRRIFDLGERSPNARLLSAPARVAALRVHGQVLLRLGAVSRAEERFDDLFQACNAIGTREGWCLIFPDLAAAHRGMARAQARMGQVEKARANFTHAEHIYWRLEGVRLVPSLEQRLLDVAHERARFLAARDHPEYVLAAYDRASEYLVEAGESGETQTAAEIHRGRARALLTLQRFQEAGEAFELALAGPPPTADAPDDLVTAAADAHAGKGTCLHHFGAHGDALLEFQIASEMFGRVFRIELAEDSEFQQGVARGLLASLLGGALAALHTNRVGEAKEAALAAGDIAQELVVEQALMSFVPVLEAARELIRRIEGAPEPNETGEQ